MKNEEIKPEEDLKADLKHDTMEYSAATDGDDVLDEDEEGYEEDAISGEELDALEDDSLDDQVAALNTEETDRMADADNLPEELWTDDIDLNDDGDDEQTADNERN